MDKQEKKQRKLNSIEIMKKKQGEKFVKGLENQPMVYSSEFVSLMVD